MPILSESNNGEDQTVQEWEKDYKQYRERTMPIARSNFEVEIRKGGHGVYDLVSRMADISLRAPQATDEEVQTMFCNMDKENPCEQTVAFGKFTEEFKLNELGLLQEEVTRLEELLDLKQRELLYLRKENDFYKELNGNKE